MNPWSDANDFKLGLQALLAKVDRELEKADRDPFSDPDPDRLPHEHDTRLLFIDELLTLLGWNRGIDGNVREEVRLKGETTKFMDYVGISGLNNKAHLLVEAKAWGKPSISARHPGETTDPIALVVSGVNHIRIDGHEKDSPVHPEWDAHLRQVAGYVRTLKEKYDRHLPRAVLLSGEWMVVFIKPVETFLEKAVPEDILFLRRADFFDCSSDIYNHLHRAKVTGEAPIPLRPAQLHNYVGLDDVQGVFRGVHAVVERTGSSLFGLEPRLRIYPVLYIVRLDDTVLTVMNGRDSSYLEDGLDIDGKSRVETHLEEITSATGALLEQCALELDGRLAISDIASFPGFAANELGRKLLRELPDPDEWLAATGIAEHFVLREPRIKDCRFHCWSQCEADKAVTGAVNMRGISPTHFFTDGQPHHCAHQVILDRREKRCQVGAIDSRICCQACVFFDNCWKPEEQAKLPCGT